MTSHHSTFKSVDPTTPHHDALYAIVENEEQQQQPSSMDAAIVDIAADATTQRGGLGTEIDALEIEVEHQQ